MVPTDMTHRALVLATIVALAALPALPSRAADPFDHDDWTAVLGAFVDEAGLVDYDGLAADRATFDRYVERVEAFSPASHPELFPTRNDELAYYINAYNALVFKGVLARGPERESVWRGLISGYGFFVAMKVRVGGRKMSLKKLEDSIIRDDYGDPRNHAALNCASVGCPRLPQTAFVGERLDEQLDAAMREFVNDPRHVSTDHATETAAVSKIFDWFKKDFGGDPVAYINGYRDEGTRIPANYRVVFPPYDKRINAQ